MSGGSRMRLSSDPSQSLARGGGGRFIGEKR